jgi:hypothetical protein
MVRRALAAAAMLVALGAASGCGEDEPQSDRDRVRGVVERFNDAFAGGDYGAACEEMHSRRRQQLEHGRGQSCEDILAGAAEIDTRLVEALGGARITTIQLQGDLAIIGVEGPSLGARQAMVERDGERGWRLSESAAGL